jgi:hypothetical protein
MNNPPSQVRTYPGRTEDEASAAFAQDAEPMAAAGYRLSSQAWAETGGYTTTAKVLLGIAVVCTAGGWLVAPALSLVALVFLVLGALGRRRGGVLTVTWTSEADDPDATSSSPRGASTDAAR